MEKLIKSKIGILIVLTIIIVIEIIAFGLSRADTIEEIDVVISDYDELLETHEGILNAINDDVSGYYIVLPEEVGDKAVAQYMVEDTSNPDGPLTTLIAGSTLYLTDEEFENKSMELKAVYDKKEVEGELLYYKKARIELDQGEIVVRGYMPLGVTATLADVDFTEIAGIVAEEIDLEERIVRTSI